MANKEYKAEIKQKLADPVLRRNLGKFADDYLVSRKKAYANKDFENIRAQIRASKDFAVNNIDALATQFAENATKRGAVVYRAADGDAVKDYIMELAKTKGVKSIVKSKSMASEEMHLNDYLAKEGLAVVETDLGEWIIQLKGHRPSHMVMPAIHLSREQIADTFSKHLGREIPVDIGVMVETARQELREKFVTAEMGISGGNMGIAETGTVVLVTNEGNARLVTSVPRIHVVIMGYEKLIPTFENAGPILEALPRSATGQQLTSYVTMLTGATPCPGPNDTEQEKELHIILLDSGRLEMAKDPVMQKAFRCIRCGSCLNVCPVYQLVGGHVYGRTYGGGIGVILTSYLEGLKQADDIQELCIACGRCKEVCPGNVPITDLIVEIRDRLFKERELPFKAKFIFNNLLSNRAIFHTGLRAAAIGGKPLTMGQPMMRHLPLYGLTEFRSLPAITSNPFRDRIKKIVQNVQQPKGKVAFFSGCATDFAYPEIGEAVVKVMNKLGYEVLYPQEQSCCGTPARYMGDLVTAKKLAKNNIAAFENAKPDYLLLACPSCTGAWVHDYENIFKDEPAWQERAHQMAAKTKEFTSFVVEEMQKNKIDLAPSNGKIKVTYHDSCHLKRNLKISEQPRALLAYQKDYQLVEMAYADRCCGCGGTFSLKFPELSAPILEAKLKTIEATEAEIVAVACPGCLMQLKGGLDKRGSKIQSKHVAELLAEQL